MFLEKICSFCLGPVDPENSRVIGKTVKDILEILLIKLEFYPQIQHKACDACYESLFALLNFKSACISTDATLIPYVFGKHKMDRLPLDLKDIYITENHAKVLKVLDVTNKEVCRLCMQLIDGELVPYQQINTDLIVKYIPEVNFKISKVPVICQSCFNWLEAFTVFLTTSLDADRVISETMTCGLKEEQELCAAQMISETNENKEFQGTLAETQYLTCCLCDCEVNDEQGQIYKKRIHNLSTPSVFHCGLCDYIGSTYLELKLHLKLHGALLVMENIQCDICEFRTDSVSLMAQHMIRHKNLREMYECDKCVYQTDELTKLNKHKKTHIDVSERKIHICTVCKQGFTLKVTLKDHMLKHKALPIYKCDFCKHQLTSKSGLRQHLTLAHGDIEPFKCYSCDYETKWKQYLVSHVRKHRDTSRNYRPYMCEFCGYKSAHKSNFNIHMLIHADMSEVEIYKCYSCKYETRNRGSLILHIKGVHRKAQTAKLETGAESTKETG